jgi:predicted extracellular nuclease
MGLKKLMSIAVAMLAIGASAADAQMRITEWMYQGANGEFAEFTNMSHSPVDMAGWFYTDSDQNPFDIDLSSFGVVRPGESVILTETFDLAFRVAWGLDASVKVIGGNADSNLGRNDEINLYRAGVLLDRLTYGDQNFAGTIRTQNRSGTPISPDVLANDDVLPVGSWVLASAGDAYGSHASTGGDLGNPGFYVDAIPEPTSIAFAALGAAAIGLGYRRRAR